MKRIEIFYFVCLFSRLTSLPVSVLQANKKLSDLLLTRLLTKVCDMVGFRCKYLKEIAVSVAVIINFVVRISSQEHFGELEQLIYKAYGLIWHHVLYTLNFSFIYHCTLIQSSEWSSLISLPYQEAGQ